MTIGKRKMANRDAERMMRLVCPDGYEEGTPYWILPNDRKTYEYKEWLEADKAYFGDEKTEGR